MIFIRSLLFNITFFAWTAVVCLMLVWVVLLPRPGMMAMVRWYLSTIAVLERVLLGLRYEVRGREHLPASGSYVVAAKHQSAWETMKLHLLLPDPAVVLKTELTKIPIWGLFARKTEMIPVDRGARGRAVNSLLDGARKVVSQGRPIVIFPQGTRTAPGVYHNYRVGVGVLYDQLHLPIVPMALNSGLYWRRRAFLKRPGTIVVEFLPAIPPGLQRFEAMIELETRLEAATDRLVIAAGGPATRRPSQPSRDGGEASPS
ncbi:MAG: lysophospholipid acyltransferase family protein [Rhodospirillaceae bacterium]